MKEVLNAHLGVLVFGGPEQGFEGADLYADTAIHAERVINISAAAMAIVNKANT